MRKLCCLILSASILAVCVCGCTKSLLRRLLNHREGLQNTLNLKINIRQALLICQKVLEFVMKQILAQNLRSLTSR